LVCAVLIGKAVADWRGASALSARGFVIVNISRFIKPGRAAASFPAQMMLRALVLVCALLPSSMAAVAAEATVLTLKDHRFVPNEVSVPAGERFRIEVENQDATPAEFESADLRVEKIIVPGGKITVMAGPLKPGTYRFFDDYHPDTATGTMTAVAKARD
jgi:heme/copper-type cytochrome/quinol oxidase subunit 2